MENQVALVQERFFSPRLRVKSYNELNAWLLDQCVAYARANRHPELRDQTVWSVLARKPGALRNGAPFKNWLLPSAMERIRRKLAGSADGDRQMVTILAAVLSDGLTAVEAACAEALREATHSADVVINILARHREPAPPVTILTPDALRLTHAPVADCPSAALPTMLRIAGTFWAAPPATTA